MSPLLSFLLVLTNGILAVYAFADGRYVLALANAFVVSFLMGEHVLMRADEGVINDAKARAGRKAVYVMLVSLVGATICLAVLFIDWLSR